MSRIKIELPQLKPAGGPTEVQVDKALWKWRSEWESRANEKIKAGRISRCKGAKISNTGITSSIFTQSNTNTDNKQKQ